ncbi:hypothetical protein BO94DRAFT_582731 [Aspergillus sclerotioniger CBS 115572]|uniref:GPI anchored cell wall protein n=1 Tax=Aspergillus sclerotioniger CBS 115572 TaxID=1450535 RepID=A0A317X728_9EURO|nr:hypothetical protein BO94DRAFT_582731 [Aspergillus sclerotioniger CBS 115572]PWY94349.1 hypothetical protein BO94DRAFT_582731 [Aspergillus sclerotioniger CBS 115572]
MKIALLLILGLAVLVSAGELVTTMYPGPWLMSPENKVASVMGNNGTETTYSITCAENTQFTWCDIDDGLTLTAGGSQTTVVRQISSVDGYEILGISQKAICSVDGTTSATCTVTDMHETPSFYTVISQGFEGESFSLVPVTITAGTITQLSDTIVTMSGSSPSRPTSHSASATSGSTSRVSSAEPSASSDGGFMSIMTTKSQASTTSSSSSVRSTGGAPMPTGEVAVIAGGAAMALLVAVL